MPLQTADGQFRIRSCNSYCAGCAVVQERDDVDVLDFGKRKHQLCPPIRQSITNSRMVGDQRRLCDVVLQFRAQLQTADRIALLKRFDSSAQAKARDVLSISWRLLDG